VEAPVPRVDTPQVDFDTLTARPMWIEKIKDGLYVIRGPIGRCMNACPNGEPVDDVYHEPGDVAVRVTSEGVILVDDKFDENVPQILALIKTVTHQPVRYLINSHYHSDHAGGTGEMLKRGVIVVDQKDLRDSYDKAPHPGESPHIVFGDYGAIYLGGVKVEAYHFGSGHTRGDTIVYFPDLKIIHTGDLVLEAMPHIDYRDGGSIVAMRNEIDSLLRLNFDFAIPGHGRLLTRDEVRHYAKKLEIMIDRMTEIVREGIPKEKALENLNLADLNWAHSASTSTFEKMDVGGFYDEMAQRIADQKAGKMVPMQP
jgi:glyoxylase-like metal-dependent hydrolase (beta-lactamase superfamily II)